MTSKLTEDPSAPGPDEFGAELAAYKIANITFKHDPKAATVDVDAQVFLDIVWGVHAVKRKDISGPGDPKVTKRKWKRIADDLRPDATGRPKRKKYWAEDLTRKHENFHASDDIGRATLYLPTASAWLATQTVGAGSVDADLRAHLETMRGQVEADGWAWYGAGGESRAYADGKADYESRVAAIEALAATNKW